MAHLLERNSCAPPVGVWGEPAHRHPGGSAPDRSRRPRRRRRIGVQRPPRLPLKQRYEHTPGKLMPKRSSWK